MEPAVSVPTAAKPRAAATQAADDFGVFAGHEIFELRAGGGGADSGDIDNIFESDGDAVKGAEIGSTKDFPLRKTGPFKSRFGCHRDVGVEQRIELFDEHEAVVREFNGRDFAVANFSAQFADCKQHLFLARPTQRLKAQFSTINCGLAK